MAQAFDQVLLEWLEASPRVPRRDRQVLLLRELMFLHAQRGFRFDAGAPDEEEVQQCSWQDSNTAAAARVSAALRRTFLDTVDTGDGRRLAETLSVSTDIDFLYRALEVDCIMSLHVAGDGPRRPSQQLRGVEDIINELSEFQESVLLLRVDLSCPQNSNVAASQPILVGGMSAVKSRVEKCTPELEIGTQVTYYADVQCSRALFDVRSVFLFSPDGARVERILRELSPRGGHDLNDVLRGVRFGSFCVE